MSDTSRRYERPRRRRPAGRLVPLAVALAALATLLTFGGSNSTQVQPTADLSQFNPGNIISDEVFFFGSALSAPQIQSFIDTKGASCVTGDDGTPCLRVYRQDTSNRPADPYCGGYAGASQEPAAVIIAKIATSCNVSPKVLLVMLEKERGLIRASGSSLTSGDYRIAMGYGCPDTAPCDAQYYGFQNQVYKAAWQMQYYAKNPGNYVYRAGRTVNIQWHPNADCGAAPVHIANQATAGLYIYTPYQPNGAALGRGGSTSCSSYGNRNFWMYFTDWFGSTQSEAIAAASPKGVVDSLVLTASGFASGGWTYDPDALSAPVTVRATVDGAVVSSVPADVSRPDVHAAFGVGENHGFLISGNLSHGTHQVCLLAENLSGQGVRIQLGCKSLTFTDRPPRVNVDSFLERADGSVHLSGWAFDPDGREAELHVYANGKGSAHTPNIARPDVQAAFAEAGPNTGFAITLPPLTTKSQVCLFGVDTVAPGNNWLATCDTFQYEAPFGAVDDISQTADGSLHVSGWALDTSIPSASPQVHVYVNGRGTALTADGNRPDIGRAFPGAGAAHGFDAVIPAGAGTHQVCLFAINVGVVGTNPILGCRTMTFKYTAPIGVVDSVVGVGDGKVWVGGWTLDPDVATVPLSVHHYVDGRWAGAFPAATSRPDIGAAFPGAGNAHGFGTVLDLGAGPHQVCTFAINAGVPGTNPFMGCYDVTAYDRAPVGSFDWAGVTGPGELTVTGWAFDPDAAAATVSVRVSIDGVAQGVFPADAARADVGRAYPAAGGQHGFAVEVPITSGAHDVCVSALSTATAATPTQLRCARVTV